MGLRPAAAGSSLGLLGRGKQDGNPILVVSLFLSPLPAGFRRRIPHPAPKARWKRADRRKRGRRLRRHAYPDLKGRGYTPRRGGKAAGSRLKTARRQDAATKHSHTRGTAASGRPATAAKAGTAGKRGVLALNQDLSACSAAWAVKAAGRCRCHSALRIPRSAIPSTARGGQVRRLNGQPLRPSGSDRLRRRSVGFCVSIRNPQSAIRNSVNGARRTSPPAKWATVASPDSDRLLRRSLASGLSLCPPPS